MKARAMMARIGILTLLLFYLGSPVFLSLDPWDAFPDGGDTAIIVLWAAALCFGGAILVAARLIGLARRGPTPASLQLPLPGCIFSPEYPRFTCPSRSPEPLRI